MKDIYIANNLFLLFCICYKNIFSSKLLSVESRLILSWYIKMLYITQFILCEKTQNKKRKVKKMFFHFEKKCVFF